MINRPAAMLLTTVLIMGAAALTISLSLALRGIGELDMGFSENQSKETLALADGCVQEALLRLSRNAGYAGGVVSVEDGSCTITVTSAGTQRTISVNATIDRWTRKITARVDIASMTLIDWKQVE